jgi:hypothetical protein
LRKGNRGVLKITLRGIGKTRYKIQGNNVIAFWDRKTRISRKKEKKKKKRQNLTKFSLELLLDGTFFLLTFKSIMQSKTKFKLEMRILQSAFGIWRYFVV